MIVRSSWPSDGDDGRPDPRQSSVLVALAFAILWAAVTLVMLVARVTGVVEALERLADVDQREAV